MLTPKASNPSSSKHSPGQTLLLPLPQKPPIPGAYSQTHGGRSDDLMNLQQVFHLKTLKVEKKLSLLPLVSLAQTWACAGFF